ncbi:ankyrin repeat domain-containing protein [Pleionea sediminis]|uniref:ankyrin repeat domain-containing protein n=1 Tax=Pleionea sediminis TaxID=2569479 RepID=UPI0011867FC4|nr:ankyrin repeat domain-containing protein [Pleionea sediminis]
MKEGSAKTLCSKAAELLYEKSIKQNMSTYTAVQTAIDICINESDNHDGCKEGSVYDERIIYHHALALAFCEFDSAWIYDAEYHKRLTKRGNFVYRDGDVHVDCQTRQFENVDSFLFFQGLDKPDEELTDSEYEKRYQESFYAAPEKGLKLFEQLITQGLDMSKTYKSGWHYGHQAVVHYAPNFILAENDDASINDQKWRNAFVKRVIEEILKTGIDINSHQEKQQTMLHSAAKKGNYAIVQFLLENKAGPKLKDANGHTPLDLSIGSAKRFLKFWKNKKSISDAYLKTIVLLGGSPEDIIVKTSTKQTQ